MNAMLTVRERDEASGNLPAGWRVRTLGQLHAGGVMTVNPQRFPGEDFEYFSIPAYQNGVIATTVRGSDILSQKFSIPATCLLFGKLNPRVEKVWNVSSSGDFRRLASTEWLAIVPTSELDQDFGYFALRSHQVMPIAQALTSGSTPSRERVEPKAFYEIKIALPSLTEQRCVASILGHVDATIALQDRAIRAARALKSATMRQLFTRGLRGEGQKETDAGPIPASWRVKTLTEVARIERGRFLYRPRNEPKFYGGVTPFVQTGDVVRSTGRIREYSQTLNDDGVAISRVFPAGTILLTIAANIGYTGILEFDGACPDSLVGISPSTEVDGRFLEFFLQTQRVAMDEQAPKGTQKNINIQFLKPWPVLVPPMDEQREIVEILDAIDRKIDLHKRKRVVLEKLFNALLHKLMTGEIRVADLDLSALDTQSTAGAVA